MKPGRKEFTGKGLFSMSRLGPSDLTHKAMEDYLSKGRYLQSVYVGNLFNRLRRRLGLILVPATKWLGATLRVRAKIDLQF